MTRTRPLLAALSVIIASCGQVAPDAANAEVTSDTITCHVQWVHDGDTFRCDGYKKSTRLYGIDAPEMPGACRQGRKCVEGDPEASKAYLTRLIGNRPLQCTITDTDHYGRPVMRCSSGGRDLSCDMVAGGYAVERYGRLGC